MSGSKSKGGMMSGSECDDDSEYDDGDRVTLTTMMIAARAA